DRYTVNENTGQNILLGVGYYIKGLDRDLFSVLYGLNAFYFAHTYVQGDVIQEDMFTNLSYHYSLSNYPIYLTAKALINTNDDTRKITLDIGIGPNFIR